MCSGNGIIRAKLISHVSNSASEISGSSVCIAHHQPQITPPCQATLYINCNLSSDPSTAILPPMKAKVDPTSTAVYDAVNAAGGCSALARALGVTRQAVYLWLHSGFMPALKALETERLYQIPRRDLIDPELLAITDGYPLDDPAAAGVAVARS